MTGEREWTNRMRRAALAETCGSLADLAESLTAAQWSLPTGCPGWDVHDQVAHVASLEAHFAGREQPPHTAPAADHVRNSIGTVMENLVDRRRGWDTARLVAELRDITALRQQQLAALDDVPDAMLTGPTGKPLPADIALLLRIFDCLAHEQDVRRAVGRPGGLDGAAGALVAERIPVLLEGAWSGRTGVVALDVDGVRTVLRLGGADGDPAVVIACSLADLVALSTGRRDAPAPTVTGDDVLGSALVESFALTP